jgi:hypothetical protein
MVALVMYCYCKGIRSSRAIEMATFDDVGARVICGNLHPDHATAARFVSRHEAAVKGLLVASLVACAKQGLVRVDVVAGDGTKVKANASMAANATAEQLEADIAELEKLLEAEVNSWLAQARAEDAAEDALFGDGGDGPGAGGGPGTLARTAGKLIRRQQAKAKLDAEYAARRQQAEAEHGERSPGCSGGWPGTRPTPPGRRPPPRPGWRTTSAAPRPRPPLAAASAPTAASRSARTTRLPSAAPRPPPRRHSRP